MPDTPQELAEAFSWVELYESDAPTDTLRREAAARLATIAEGVERITAELRSGGQLCNAVPRDDRADLAHLLANLNSAELHVTDYLGS